MNKGNRAGLYKCNNTSVYKEREEKFSKKKKTVAGTLLAHSTIRRRELFDVRWKEIEIQRRARVQEFRSNLANQNLYTGNQQHRQLRRRCCCMHTKLSHVHKYMLRIQLERDDDDDDDDDDERRA
uniref:Uncharacterized protein n=1 Tax=Trichogramma kaykai TaxID=54128 RepID=A0ABD2X777_9HYME